MITKYLIAIGVFIAYSCAVYSVGRSHQETVDRLSNSSVTLTQTQQARSTEQALNTESWNIDAAYQKGLQEGRKNAQTLTDSLLSGSVGMYVPEIPTAAAVPGTTKAVSKPSAEARCQLPAKTAADLTRLAADADDIVRQSNALVDYYEDVLSRLGHPELILEGK